MAHNGILFVVPALAGFVSVQQLGIIAILLFVGGAALGILSNRELGHTLVQWMRRRH